MMHDYTVLMINRIEREEAARRSAKRELLRQATAGNQPRLLALVTRLLNRRPARPAQPARETCYPVPCQPARDSLTL